ncbi:MAG: UDP-N-acetylmuramate--L-alanine ligase [Anaerolineae bacterium]|nr:UDP-N-acetylmuramate--L-alanine ligase [Anaerolineae bacterium]
MTDFLPRSVHFVGVGGSGLSALARVALGLGLRASGSDRCRSSVVPPLEALGLTFQLGHEPLLVRGTELVVATSAVGEDNPEIAWARAHGIPVWKRHQFLPWLAQGKRLLAIAGTHGKTTTTALVAHLLTVTRQDPTCVVGGVLEGWGTNARVGGGDLFVLEADEYDRTFLSLDPWLGVVTTVEEDHPDCYPTREAVEEAFGEFMRRCRQRLVNGDDPGVGRALARAGTGLSVTYGRGEPAAWRLLSLTQTEEGTEFRFRCPDGSELDSRVRLWGRHSAENSLAALAAASTAGVPILEAAEALGTFGGVKRRFTVSGPFAGIYLVDDYAHHPTAIGAVIEAARQRFPGRRLVAVVQPHTFSRLESLFDGFVQSLRLADVSAVLPVYASRERGDSVAASRKLADASGALALPSVTGAAGLLLGMLRPGDVVLNLGAGDGETVTRHLAEALATDGVVHEA